jgi:cell division protein FtsB
MKDEIKEIIRLNCEEEIDVKYFAKDNSLVDTTMDYSQLLDYITNLQEEVNKLTAESTEWESKCYDLQEELKEYKMIFDTFSKRPYAHRYLEEKKKELGNKNIIGLDSEMIYKDYYDLKEENERLKALNKEYIYELGLNEFENTTIMNIDYKDEYIDYKSRNEKAIEYINNDLLISVLPNNQIINGNEVVKRINYIEKLLNGDDKYE